MLSTLLEMLSHLFFLILNVTGAHNFPRPLSAEEEKRCVIQWKEHNDRAAVRRMIGKYRVDQRKSMIGDDLSRANLRRLLEGNGLLEPRRMYQTRAVLVCDALRAFDQITDAVNKPYSNAMI